MARVGRHALASVDRKLFQAAYIFVRFGEYPGDALILFGFVGSGVKVDVGEVGQFHSFAPCRVGKTFFQIEGTADEVIKGIIVEIRIGDGGEQCVDHLMACFAGGEAFFTQRAVYRRDASHGVEKQVHPCRCLGVFSAYADFFASFATHCLLTLVAKHFRAVVHVCCR